MGCRDRDPRTAGIGDRRAFVFELGWRREMGRRRRIGKGDDRVVEPFEGYLVVPKADTVNRLRDYPKHASAPFGFQALMIIRLSIGSSLIFLITSAS
jgi:hypothetical protein